MSYFITKAKFLSSEEYTRLDQDLAESLPKDFRNVVMLWTAMHTGARASEVLNIKKSDLDRNQGTVYIHGLKGSRDRDLPVPGGLAVHLSALSLVGEDEYIFPIALRTMQSVWHHYRPNPLLGIKCLRHTFAVRLYEKTKDLKLVQLALGHKGINNTMVYADFVYNMEELKRLIL